MYFWIYYWGCGRDRERGALTNHRQVGAGPGLSRQNKTRRQLRAWLTLFVWRWRSRHSCSSQLLSQWSKDTPASTDASGSSGSPAPGSCGRPAWLSLAWRKLQPRAHGASIRTTPSFTCDCNARPAIPPLTAQAAARYGGATTQRGAVLTFDDKRGGNVSKYCQYCLQITAVANAFLSDNDIIRELDIDFFFLKSIYEHVNMLICL